MSPNVKIAKLDGQQLTLHPVGIDDYAVKVSDQVAGRIILRSLTSGSEVWFWTMTGPELPLDMRPSHGEADTLTEATDAFLVKFDLWLAWANGLTNPPDWPE
jgi:hypothetical protein